MTRSFSLEEIWSMNGVGFQAHGSSKDIEDVLQVPESKNGKTPEKGQDLSRKGRYSKIVVDSASNSSLGNIFCSIVSLPSQV